MSHRSALSLTAHSLCRGLGDAATAPLQGRDPRVPVRPRPGQLPLAPAAPELRARGEPWVQRGRWDFTRASKGTGAPELHGETRN